MKKILLLFSVFLSSTTIAIAQEETTGAATEEATPAPESNWKCTNMFKLGFSQASFTNWKAGGDNAIAGVANFKSNVEYKKDKNDWVTTLELAYGLSQQNKDKIKKSDDKIELNTTFGHQATKHWYYSALGKFTTQFDKGYANPEDTIYASKFMLPARMLLTPGMQYVNEKGNFKTFLSPIGVEATYISDTNYTSMYGVDNGEHWYVGYGAFVRVEYNATLWENVILATKLDLFTDYRSKDFKYSTSVTWDLRLDMKINKFLTASIETGLIYDPKTLFFENSDGSLIEGGERRVQFKEIFMLNIVYTF